MTLKSLAIVFTAAISLPVVGCSKQSAQVVSAKPMETTTPVAAPKPAAALASAPAPAPATRTQFVASQPAVVSDPKALQVAANAAIMEAAISPATRARYLTPQASKFPSVTAPIPALAPADPAAPAPAPVVAAGPDPRADLKTAMSGLVQLIETKDYPAIFKYMTPPSALADLPKNANLDVIAKAATKDPSYADAMSEVQEELEAIKGHTPVMGDNGKEATFSLDPPIGEDDKVVFKLESGLWYPTFE